MEVYRTTIDLKPVRKNDILFLETFAGFVPFVVTRTSPKEGFIYATADMSMGNFLHIRVSYSDNRVFLLGGDKVLTYYELWAYAKVKYDNEATQGVVLAEGIQWNVVQTEHAGKLVCYIQGTDFTPPPAVVFDLPEKGSVRQSEFRLPNRNVLKVTYLGVPKGLKLVYNV